VLTMVLTTIVLLAARRLTTRRVGAQAEAPVQAQPVVAGG
jgi:hypothetical protein